MKARTDPMDVTPVEQMLDDVRNLERSIHELGIAAERYRDHYTELADAVREVDQADREGRVSLAEWAVVLALLDREARERRFEKLGGLLMGTEA